MTPTLALPSPKNRCIPDGKSTVSVTWAEITAADSNGQNVTCTDSVDVPLTGRHFGVGLHTVTCSVTNDGNCTGTGSFTFNVASKLMINFRSEIKYTYLA